MSATISIRRSVPPPALLSSERARVFARITSLIRGRKSNLSQSRFFCVCFSFLFLDFFSSSRFFSSLLLKCEKCRRRLPRTYVKEKGLY